MEIIDRVSSRSIELKTSTDIYHIQLLPTDLFQIVKVNTLMGICHSAMYNAFSIDLASSNSITTSGGSSRVARNCFLLSEMPNPGVYRRLIRIHLLWGSPFKLRISFILSTFSWGRPRSSRWNAKMLKIWEKKSTQSKRRTSSSSNKIRAKTKKSVNLRSVLLQWKGSTTKFAWSWRESNCSSRRDLIMTGKINLLKAWYLIKCQTMFHLYPLTTTSRYNKV